MNIRPVPPDAGIEELRAWCEELHDFLTNPVFETIRLKPRSSVPDTEKGRIYYDSDTDLFYGYTGSFDEFGDIT